MDEPRTERLAKLFQELQDGSSVVDRAGLAEDVKAKARVFINTSCDDDAVALAEVIAAYVMALSIERKRIGVAMDPELADYVLCGLATEEAIFADNLTAPCAKCGTLLQFRPYVPKRPKKICMNCMDAIRASEVEPETPPDTTT